MMGWLLARACFDAWRFGDESQQRVPPHVWHVRRCTQRLRIFTQSSHSRFKGSVTAEIARKWSHPSSIDTGSGWTADVKPSAMCYPSFQQQLI
jgi:hypothetical protein